MEVNKKGTDKSIARFSFSKIDLSMDPWPIAVLVLLILAIFYINFYFQHYFSFAIFSYLDLSEMIIVAFVNLGVLDLGAEFTRDFFAKFSILYLFFRFLNLMFVFSKKKNYGDKSFLNFYEIISFFLICFVFNSSLEVAKIMFDSDFSNGTYLVIVIVLAILMLVAFSFFLILTEENPSYFRDNIVELIVFSLVFLVPVSTLMAGKKRHGDLVNKHFSYGSKIFTEKDTLVSDSNFYYVDKSRNYVFMWKEKDSSMVVIPMSEIKKMEIKNGAPKTNKPPQKKVNQTNKKTSKK